MRLKDISFFLILGILFSVLITSCQKDEFYTGTDIILGFSEDTLRFDTVFTTLGSATRYIKLYNDKDKRISINSIRLQEETNSFFRLNVDGTPGLSFENIEIPPQDSIYIFAEVTIDPDQPLSISPFIIEEQILIDAGENQQVIHLEAWGQNANYIPPSKRGGSIYFPFCNSGEIVWDDPKPYVIYGILIIADCKLILPKGTSIYVHGGIAISEESVYNDGIIAFLKGGSLSSRGTVDEPVIIQGDRLEAEFQDVSGQWGGIRFLDESRNNELEHTIIKNSIVGIRADSLASVNLKACQIYNTSSSGIVGFHSSVYAENTLVHSNGSYGVQFSYGGNYELNYCSVASYSNQSEALYMTNYRCTDALCLGPKLFNPLRVDIRNSIFTGSSGDEIFMDDINAGMDPQGFQYNLQNCVVTVDELTDAQNFPNFFDNCSPCIKTDVNSAIFADRDIDDYRLDTLSVCEGQALPLALITRDIEEQFRDANMPDIGCYEYQY